MADPDLQIRGEGRGGGVVSKTFFAVLRASVWSKSKVGALTPRAPPVDPPLLMELIDNVQIQRRSYIVTCLDI